MLVIRLTGTPPTSPQCVVDWLDCITAHSYLVVVLSHNHPHYFYLTQAHALEALSGFSYSTFPPYPSEHHRFIPEISRVCALLRIPKDMVSLLLVSFTWSPCHSYPTKGGPPSTLFTRHILCFKNIITRLHINIQVPCSFVLLLIH